MTDLSAELPRRARVVELLGALGELLVRWDRSDQVVAPLRDRAVERLGGIVDAAGRVDVNAGEALVRDLRSLAAVSPRMASLSRRRRVRDLASLTAELERALADER